MTALRKFGVFLPQVILLALTAGGSSAVRVLDAPAWSMLAAWTAGAAGLVCFITTFVKIANISDNGWGHFDAALQAECASCRGYQLNNARLKRELTEAREALSTLRLP